MPKPPVAPHIDEFLARPNPAVLASIRPNGTPHTCAVWYGWRDGRVLLTFDQTRKRLDFIRANPAVSLTVLDGQDWFKNVTLSGRVEEIVDDDGLREVDQLSLLYMNRPYPDRVKPRVVGWMDISSWFAWNAYAEVTNLSEGGTPLDRPAA